MGKARAPVCPRSWLKDAAEENAGPSTPLKNASLRMTAHFGGQVESACRMRFQPRMLNGPQNSDGKEDDRSDQFERAADGDSYDAKRQQQQPDYRIENQRNQRQRPTQYKKNAPQ